MIEINGAVATLTLNRPEVHNALNMQMIRQLRKAIESLEGSRELRIVVLRSNGKDFSAGADLNWMREGQKQTAGQLESESMELADLFRLISETHLLVLSALQGHVLGGANGLVAASDIVIAENTARFAFSEVKLGLVPATIAPYILRKAGYSRTSELMLSGRSFDAETARLAGLVHHVCEEGTLQDKTDQVLRELLSNGPEAMKGIKELLRTLESGQYNNEIQEYTAGVLARVRISPEGQEGMNAFFEKRNPGWHEEL